MPPPTEAGKTPRGRLPQPGPADGVHIQTATLDLHLALGSESMTTNALRDLMNHTFQIDLGVGNPSPDAFLPEDTIASYREKARQQFGEQLGNYGPTQGELSFREAIAAYYAEQGTVVNPADIVVVNGAQEALAIASLLVPQGGEILTSDPTYIGFMQPMKLRRPQYVAVDPRQPDTLTEALRTHSRVALIYDQPTLHNPMTITQTADQRRGNVEAAVGAKALVLEDSPYMALYDGGAQPTMHSYAPDNVILAGSMSKLFQPALRTGWVVITNPKIRDLFIQIKQGLNIATSRTAQAEAESFLRDPRREQHLAEVRILYAARRDAAMEAARQYLPDGWAQNMEDPHGGMFLAFRNPNSSITSNAIAARAKELGLAIVPFEIFSPSQTTQGLRANVIYNSPAITAAGFQILGQVIRELEAAA